jgi:hypothetical protein
MHYDYLSTKFLVGMTEKTLLRSTVNSPYQFLLYPVSL